MNLQCTAFANKESMGGWFNVIIQNAEMFGFITNV